MASREAGWRRVLANVRSRRQAAAAARHNRDRGTHCFYCAVAFTVDDGTEDDRTRTVDHRVPRGRGGTDGLANLVFACRACNRRKADTPEDEFVASEWLRERRRSVSTDSPP